MNSITVTKTTPIGEIIKTPAGHDILAKALLSVGMSLDMLKKGPLSKLTLEKIQKISGGKISAILSPYKLYFCPSSKICGSLSLWSASIIKSDR